MSEMTQRLELEYLNKISEIAKSGDDEAPRLLKAKAEHIANLLYKGRKCDKPLREAVMRHVWQLLHLALKCDPSALEFFEKPVVEKFGTTSTRDTSKRGIQRGGGSVQDTGGTLDPKVSTGEQHGVTSHE